MAKEVFNVVIVNRRFGVFWEKKVSVQAPFKCRYRFKSIVLAPVLEEKKKTIQAFPPSCLPCDTNRPCFRTSSQADLRRCWRFWKEVRSALLSSVAHTRHLVDRRRFPSPTYCPGQKVWLPSRDLPLHVKSSKLAPASLSPMRWIESSIPLRSSSNSHLNQRCTQPSTMYVWIMGTDCKQPGNRVLLHFWLWT